MYYLEIFIVIALLILSVVSFILNKSTFNLIKVIVCVLVCALLPVMVFFNLFLDKLWIYDIVSLSLIIVNAMFIAPRKVTKNITEYDYFELEKGYSNLKDDKENLRQRYLSTITLIDEGIIFYENNAKEVILSDHAYSIFGGKQSSSIEEHAMLINPQDREEYIKTIDRTTKKTMTFEMKYRISRGNETIWILERGHYIGVGSKKSIISVIVPLDIRCFKRTAYFDVDSLYSEEKIYPIIKQLVENQKPFSFVMFELSNISIINEKYSREIGSLMINDYIKFMKNNYQKDITKFFRITGIRFALIIDDLKVYQNFHDAVTNPQSDIYNTKIQVSSIKDVVVPNFGIINLNGNRQIDSIDLVKLSNKLLEEAISSNRRNYSILGD